MASEASLQEEASFQDMPDEILEYILSTLSPYRDFKSAMLVCKRWHKVMQSVSMREQSNFLRAVHEGKLEWRLLPVEAGPTITERYSHSSCYHERSMYVFGGCTFSSTTFNDLWRLDLGTGEWVRPLATGTYPSPKACASLVSARDQLLLFGGWSHPTPCTFHQGSKFFNQLHSYTPETNKWTLIYTEVSPPGKAGHGASVVGRTMVIFGGHHGHSNSSNEVWVYDIDKANWRRMDIPGTKPLPRYGHSQVVLDEHHILVIGGCGGPNMQFGDVWALDMSEPKWSWHEIQVLQSANAPQQLWCHGACKIDDVVAVLCKTNRVPKSPPPAAKVPFLRPNKLWVPPRSEEQGAGSRNLPKFKRSYPETSESSSQESSSDQEDTGIGRVSLHSPGPPRSSRGSAHRAGPSTSRLTPQEPVPSSSSTADPAAGPSHPTLVPPRSGLPSVRPNAMKNRQKQLETLRRYETKIKQQMNRSQPQRSGGASSNCQGSGGRSQNPMFLHVLDISKALTEKQATWLPIPEDSQEGAPEETIFYSLVEGRGELILFGGIQTDLNSMQRGLTFTGSSQVVKNTVHFLSAIKSLQ